MRKVYITGLGFITSIGNDLLAVAESLRELRHGIVQYPPFQKADVPVKVAAPIRDFQTDSTDQEDWIFPARYNLRRETLRGMAPHGIYAYCAMQQAVEDAKLTEAEWSTPTPGSTPPPPAPRSSSATIWRKCANRVSCGARRSGSSPPSQAR